MNTASPVLVVFPRGLRPRIVRQVTLLPQPDSPTIASVLPFSTENDTPSTAPHDPIVRAELRLQIADIEKSHAVSLPGSRQASLMRGSIHAYNRSTSRLKPITITEAKTVTPRIFGKSNW